MEMESSLVEAVQPPKGKKVAKVEEIVFHEGRDGMAGNELRRIFGGRPSRPDIARMFPPFVPYISYLWITATTLREVFRRTEEQSEATYREFMQIDPDTPLISPKAARSARVRWGSTFHLDHRQRIRVEPLLIPRHTAVLAVTDTKVEIGDVKAVVRKQEAKTLYIADAKGKLVTIPFLTYTNEGRRAGKRSLQTMSSRTIIGKSIPPEELFEGNDDTRPLGKRSRELILYINPLDYQSEQ